MFFFASFVLFSANSLRPSPPPRQAHKSYYFIELLKQTTTKEAKVNCFVTPAIPVTLCSSLFFRCHCLSLTDPYVRPPSSSHNLRRLPLKLSYSSILPPLILACNYLPLRGSYGSPLISSPVAVCHSCFLTVSSTYSLLSPKQLP